MTVIQKKLLSCALGFVLASFGFLAGPSKAENTPENAEASMRVVPQEPKRNEAEGSQSNQGADEGRSPDADSVDAVEVGKNNRIFSIAQNSVVKTDEVVRSVTTLFGHSWVERRAHVHDAVITVLGDSTVLGSSGGTITVMGHTSIGGPVGNVTVVMGNLTLSRDARVYGDVTVIGGSIKRKSGAIVKGQVTKYSIGEKYWLDSFKTWVKECFVYGRPLALKAGLGWAWIFALSVFALCLLSSFMSRAGVEKCSQLIEMRPRGAVLTAIFALAVTPVLYLALWLTGLGIVVVPILWLLLFVFSLFGKAVVLAIVGRIFTRRITKGLFAHPAFAVLVGIAVVLPLMVVPVLGFVVYELLDVLGLGFALYWLILDLKTGIHTHLKPQETQSPVVTGETPTVASVPAPAQGWIRLMALGIDVVLVGSLLAFTGIFKYSQVWLLVLAAYGAFMWRFKGTTIGGVVMGLRLVRQDGQPLDWTTAIVRALACFLSLLPLGIGFFWMFLDHDKQAWHDKIAGTHVLWSPKRVGFWLGSARTTQDLS